MVAYSFKKQFADKIRSGEKRHTIRRNGRRRHARPGEMLQLYTGMRTKQCKKIMADQQCELVVPVAIQVAASGIESIKLGGEPVDDMEEFAKSDGFEDLESMSAFWLEFHGVGLFDNASMVGWKYSPEE